MNPTREGRAPQAFGWPVVIWAGWMTAALEFTTLTWELQYVSDWTYGQIARCILQPAGHNEVPRYATMFGYALNPKEPNMASFLEKFIEETARLMVDQGIIPADKQDRFIKELRQEYITNLGPDCLQLDQKQAIARIQTFAEKHYASPN